MRPEENTPKTDADQTPRVQVVVATRLGKDRFFSESSTGLSLANFQATSRVRVRLFYENLLGLSEIYNTAIEEVINEDVTLVFVHDDVVFTDFFWTDRVLSGLSEFDLVGVVGNTRRSHNQASWIIRSDRSLDDRKYLSGAIGQDEKGSFPPKRLDVFGPSGLECKLLDGVFLAIRSCTLRESGLRFDPQFKFHFYDMDFCRAAESRKLKLGTIPLSVIHKSYGQLNSEWHDSYKKYLAKWGV